LVPSIVNVPAPFLTRDPCPEIRPEKVVDVLSPPVVRVWVPRVTLEPATPASEPTIWLAAEMSNVAPFAMEKALFGLKEFSAPPASVPALMVVAPV